MNENDRKILTRACGLEWVDYSIPTNDYEYRNPGFDSPDDWELVRVKVVVPNFYEIMKDIDVRSLIIALVMQTPQMMCLFILNWIKASPDLFPWITEMLKEEV